MYNLLKKLFGLKDRYDYNTIEGIMSIPIPKNKSLRSRRKPSQNIESILQKKATEHKKNGRMDLAIACLRKANEIFQYSSVARSEKEYMRLVEYLKQDRQFEEARREESKIKQIFNYDRAKTIENEIKSYQKLFGKTDIVSTNETAFVCEECAKYTKRFFSISGKSKKYPKLPEYLLKDLPEHKYCSILLYPVIDGVSEPAWDYRGDFIKFCNRPFVDERTKEQKAIFEKDVKEKEEAALDKEFYDLVFEKYPDIAPKTFGGYRRMKAANTSNYQKLLIEVEKRLGYNFYAK